MLTLSHISKQFGAVAALTDVSLTCARGQVHGLVGENGAGKSTLMHIVFGLLAPDQGTISINNKITAVHSPAHAQQCGIGMVHQHFALIPTLSVVDNIILALQSTLGRCDRQQWAQRIRACTERLHWNIDPAAIVETLAVGQQQRVEIIKALIALEQSANESRTLILDEPTAVLTDSERDELMVAIKSLAADGVAVLFISHKLPEITQVCDVVTVLRRGKITYHGDAQTPIDTLATHMVGEAVDQVQNTPQPATAAAMQVISLENVSVQNSKKEYLLRDINLSVRKGEIVGIAGVEGNGQATLINVLIGAVAITNGVMHSPFDPHTCAYIPDDRHRDALVLPMSVEQNVMLKHYGMPAFSHHGFLTLSAWRRHVQNVMVECDIRAPGAEVPIATLSGGNQQKAVIGREFYGNPSYIIAVNPTRGLDIAAAQSVLRNLVQARNNGAAVLLVHNDIDEIMAIADRLLVMQRGCLLPSKWPDASRADIAQLMAGVGK